MRVKLFFACAIFFFFYGFGQAQQTKTIHGIITDASEVPLPGAQIKVDGKDIFDVTDFDGNFTLKNVAVGDVFQVTFLGFKNQEVQVTQKDEYNISLQEDAGQLDEVVVVGYGTQKKADLTGAISTVKSEEIQKTPTGQAMQALQGKVAGLQIVNNGGPGSEPTVRIRGVGSYSGDASSPLYVVDGMFFDSIEFLNPSDIESISVLKDASAAAIYGVRAANGVVLIETKSGHFNQKPRISYDGYTGFQRAQNVVKMANSEQFATIARESGSAPDAQFIQNAMQRYGRSRINPNIPAVNTDWYKEILREGLIQNHSLNVTGGGDNSKYSIGANYFSQQGILDMKNEYQRFNLRSKLEFEVNDFITLGGNALLSNATRYDPEASAWRLAYYAVPILPVYDNQNTNAEPVNYANAQDLGYRGGQNPFPTMDFAENRNKIRNVVANFYAKLNIIPEKLSFKTAYNHNFETVNRREVRLPYFIGNNFQREDASLLKRATTISNQIWDNTLTYKDSYGNHNLTVLAGSSFRDESYEMLQAKGLNFPLSGEEAYFIDLAQTIVSDDTKDDARREYGLSYFGRIAYDYDGRYLLYGTFRADGTNKYQDKWGYFPTVGAGWVLSKENFLQNNEFINFLKLRASWGQLGNDHIASSEGSITSEVVTTALGDTRYSGVNTSSDYTALKWELTEETNFGLTATLFNDLSVEADYYIRDTKDAVIPVPRPLIPGSTRQNVGEIRNKGLEVVLGWNQNVSADFNYSIGANFSTLKNEILNLHGAQYIDAGSAEFRQRSIVGNSLFAFYGREVVGVYQNDAEIQADPVAVANNLVPGDLKYRDLNGDGQINDDDRKVLGSYLPSYQFGFNLGATYKAFDLSAAFFGQGGNKILNRKRGEVIFTSDTNIDRDFAINRWHGEGTSNSYPSAAGIRKGWNQKLSDYFVEDGDFFRIQNITLGYTLNKDGKLKNIPETRFYLTAEKPLTVFNYNGFNPEIPDGVDNQTYPVPATYTLGVNIKI
ncbi:MAG: TonB-dependent receptor [Salegentibacter sp.]